ncbi:hypothetical protein [Desulfotalea psychrophila]|uniref:Uncharacterized protein n=1 Tax=Desulfotalea psychrophila (strain LSv54 / DSM 12343) TaxID=177439 RepID=Q6ANP0_DESPS|nr:hypothetical protein [Desulfotalea psychrophila]CAG36034.1 unknown protein [Desulfotalea psychrophila LSv54]
MSAEQLNFLKTYIYPLVVGGIGGGVAVWFTQFLKDKSVNKEREREADKKLFAEFLKDFSSDLRVMYFFASYNFSTELSAVSYDEFDSAIDRWKKPLKKFHDKNIEKQKTKFMCLCDRFIEFIESDPNFFNQGIRGYLMVPKKYREDEFLPWPKELWKKKEKVTDDVKKLVACHQKFLSTGKSKLRI